MCIRDSSNPSPAIHLRQVGVANKGVRQERGSLSFRTPWVLQPRLLNYIALRISVRHNASPVHRMDDLGAPPLSELDVLSVVLHEFGAKQLLRHLGTGEVRLVYDGEITGPLRLALVDGGQLVLAHLDDADAPVKPVAEILSMRLQGSNGIPESVLIGTSSVPLADLE
eukprot:8626190-Pyramimonas_sp.AAC.1